jgi:hypothetical protein
MSIHHHPENASFFPTSFPLQTQVLLTLSQMALMTSTGPAAAATSCLQVCMWAGVHADSGCFTSSQLAASLVWYSLALSSAQKCWLADFLAISAKNATAAYLWLWTGLRDLRRVEGRHYGFHCHAEGIEAVCWTFERVFAPFCCIGASDQARIREVKSRLGWAGSAEDGPGWVPLPERGSAITDSPVLECLTLWIQRLNQACQEAVSSRAEHAAAAADLLPTRSTARDCCD